jgi:hypothetical protein
MPKSKAQATPNAVAAQTVTDVVTSAISAHGDLVQQAISGIQKVQQATGELTGLLPSSYTTSPVSAAENAVLSEAGVAANAIGLGPLANQVIKLVPRF